MLQIMEFCSEGMIPWNYAIPQSYCLTSDHNRWDPELMQWKIPWLHPLLEGWPQFCPAGKTSFHGYDYSDCPWEIAW